jgi:hypothetical protein
MIVRSVLFSILFLCTTAYGETLSRIAQQHGFTHAIHATHQNNLEGILCSQTLITGSKAIGCVPGDPFGNHDAVFLSLARVNAMRVDKLLLLNDNRLPILVFALEETIDRYPFHANIGYKCGRHFPSDAADGSHYRTACSHESDAFRHFVAHPHAHRRNEIVFRQSLSLDGLVTLYVARGEKQSLLDLIEREQLAPPQGLKWDDIICEVTPLRHNIPLLKLLSQIM